MQNQEGRKVPQIVFRTRKDGDWHDIDSQSIFAGRRVFPKVLRFPRSARPGTCCPPFAIWLAFRRRRRSRSTGRVSSHYSSNHRSVGRIAF